MEAGAKLSGVNVIRKVLLRLPISILRQELKPREVYYAPCDAIP